MYALNYIIKIGVDTNICMRVVNQHPSFDIIKWGVLIEAFIHITSSNMH